MATPKSQPPRIAVSPPGAPARRPPATPRPGHKRFHLGAFALSVTTGLVVLTAAWLVRQLVYHRFESSPDLALGAAIGAGILLAAAGGFVAGRVGRKLCLLEHLAAQAAVFAVFLTLAGTVRSLGAAVGLSQLGTLGAVAGALAGAAAGVLLFAFLGSSLGYLLGGGGALDTKFSYERFIAVRHLFHKKRTAFLSFITVLSVLAVAIGVWCLVVVLSVMSGFEDDLKQKILGTNAHAMVLKYVAPFSRYDELAEEVREVRGVSGVSPFIYGEVMVSSESHVNGVLLKGILPERVGEVTDLPENVEEGKGSLDFLSTPERIDAYLAQNPGAALGLPNEDAPEDAAVTPGIAIGKELARSLRVFVGDQLTVISPISEDMGPTGPVPRSKTFRVAAIFYTGMYEYDSKFAYIHLAEAQKFFDMKDGVTGLELRTTDIDDTRAITRRILAKIEGYPYYTKDWGEMNRNLFSALKLEKLVMAVILAFIVLVASFVILATLVMMVMEKGKEIAILKSMGVRDASIMKIFVLEGLAVGIAGTALGLVLGLTTCAIVASGIISLDPEVYYISTLPVRIEPAQVVLVCVVALVLSYLATIYPSVTASRLHPVEGLRDD